MIQSTKVNLIFNRLTLRRKNLLTAQRIFYQGNATKHSKASSDRKTPRLSVQLARFGWFALMNLPSCTLLTFLIVVYLPYYINLLMASLLIQLWQPLQTNSELAPYESEIVCCPGVKILRANHLQSLWSNKNTQTTL